MAKKGKGRKSLAKVRSVSSFALSTLGDGIVAQGNATSNLTHPAWVAYMRLLIGARNHTDLEGPYMVGVCSGDLDATEVKEALEVDLTGPASRIERERSTRPVRIIGYLKGDPEERMNDGKAIYVRCGWYADEGMPAAKVFAYNQSGSTFTTGTVVEYNGSTHVRWT